jgi:hypothetical protein
MNNTPIAKLERNMYIGLLNVNSICGDLCAAPGQMTSLFKVMIDTLLCRLMPIYC